MHSIGRLSAVTLLLLAGLLGPGLKGNLQSADENQQQKKSDQRGAVATKEGADAAALRRTYEDIEVLSRLLRTTLAPYALADRQHAIGTLSQMGARWYGNIGIAAPAPASAKKDPHEALGIEPMPIDGVLLPAGVVITADVPMPFSIPKKEISFKTEVLTPWDRARREYLGEKTEPAVETKSNQSIHVIDAVVRLLAENGYHLTELEPDQSVTIVLTYRGGWTQQCTSCHGSGTRALDFDGDSNTIGVAIGANSAQSAISDSPTNVVASPYSAPSHPNSYSPGYRGQNTPGQYVSQAEGSVATALLLNAREGQNDHILVGDLHFKQGRYQEALAAYKKALTDYNTRLPNKLESGSAQENARLRETVLRAIEVLNKIIQCDVALKQEENINGGVALLKKWMALLDKLEVQAKHSQLDSAQRAKRNAPTLPTKTIITAPKKALDDVGNRRITFEQFVKRIKVEYVRFE